tara:strand:+ start:5571 stop:6233 length:663 start_codon:yes stop_codon:yes gene_type:complete
MLDQIRRFVKLMMPKGRAFSYPTDGIFDRLNKAVALSSERAVNDFNNINNHILPDNDNFTVFDADLWEKRLGLVTNQSTSLSDRKLAIIRKYRHPGGIIARQSADYIQNELQSAGFNVFVHENIPELPFVGTDVIRLGQVRLGQTRLGKRLFKNKVANYIDESLDEFFDEGTNFKQSFSIGGAVLGTDTDVLLVRKNEFRKLILSLKPCQTIAQLRINYI